MLHFIKPETYVIGDGIDGSDNEILRNDGLILNTLLSEEQILLPLLSLFFCVLSLLKHSK